MLFFAPPIKGYKSVFCFHLSNGHLGIRTVHGFLDLVGLMEGASLVWGEFVKGFCTVALGRAINFQVVASGSQQSWFISNHHIPGINCLYRTMKSLRNQEIFWQFQEKYWRIVSSKPFWIDEGNWWWMACQKTYRLSNQSTTKEESVWILLW